MDSGRPRGRPPKHRPTTYEAAPPYEDAEAAELQRQIEALEPATPDEDDEAIANTLAIEQSLPTWRSIFEAPRTGEAVTVRFEDRSLEPRYAKWKAGRVFLHRRWHPGGSWIAADSMQPLPAHPSEYLHYEREEAVIPESGA